MSRITPVRHKVLPRGSAAAAAYLRSPAYRALRWPFGAPSLPGTQDPARPSILAAAAAAAAGRAVVSEAYEALVDVVLVHGVRADGGGVRADGFGASGRWDRTTWCADYLRGSLGFLSIERSSLVVDVDAGEGMALFVAGECLVRDVTDRFPDLHRLMSAVHKPTEKRRKTDNARILMAGLRFVPYLDEDKRLWWYATRPSGSAAAAAPAADREVRRAAEALGLLLALVSPSAGAHSTTLARLACGSLGPLPGVERQHGPTSIGASMGYVSLPHYDQGQETVAFDGRAVSPADGWAFALVKARVVCRLRTETNASTFVTLPGGHLHGTPHLSVGRADDHKGIGVVACTKEVLAAAAAPDQGAAGVRLRLRRRRRRRRRAGRRGR